MTRPRRGTGQRVRARELRPGDTLTGTGHSVLAVEPIKDGAKVRVSLVRVSGSPLQKDSGADEMVEVQRRPE